MGSNYGPTIRVQRKALRKGCQQVLWLYGEDHQVTEVGTMNIFMFYVNERGGIYQNRTIFQMTSKFLSCSYSIYQSLCKNFTNDY